MGISGQRARIPAVLIVAFAVACGSSQKPEPDPEYGRLIAPGTSKPADAVEQEILAKLDKIAADTAIQVEGRTVIAGTPYHAASGRTCRRVSISAGGAERDRLACVVEGTWSFVPDVVGPRARGSGP